MIIEKTGFGWIVIDGQRYESDILITPTGEIKNRYEDFLGSSHAIDLNEAKKLISGEPKVIIIGTGQGGVLKIPLETKRFWQEKGIEVKALPTPEAIKLFNEERRKKSALFHLTC